ncbi:MAG: hypothetical protein WB626_06490 [Bacteroidota bacterium]
MAKVTSRKVEEPFSRSLGDLDLVVLMIDGISIAGHTVVVALGGVRCPRGRTCRVTFPVRSGVG